MLAVFMGASDRRVAVNLEGWRAVEETEIGCMIATNKGGSVHVNHLKNRFDEVLVKIKEVEDAWRADLAARMLAGEPLEHWAKTIADEIIQKHVLPGIHAKATTLVSTAAKVAVEAAIQQIIEESHPAAEKKAPKPKGKPVAVKT
jgi:hypothetical protein